MDRENKTRDESELSWSREILLPSNRFFIDAPCRGMTQLDVADSEICMRCPKLIECMHYSVNNPAEGYIAGMDEDMREEWKKKAYLSGEKEGEISRRRCYQHVRFMERHRIRGDINLPKHEKDSLKPDYYSIMMDVSGRLVNQCEPAIQKVEDLPTYIEEVGIGPKSRYRINKNKYIGPEFLENPDLLVVGGSESMPVFVPPEKLWTTMLSEVTGIKINNMSIPYGTVLIKIQNLFYHLKTFGAPKNLVFFLPNISFTDFPISTAGTGTHQIFYNAELSLLSDRDGYINEKVDISIMGDNLKIKELEPNLQLSRHLYEKAIQDSLSYMSIVSSVFGYLNCKVYYLTTEFETDKILKELNIEGYAGHIHYMKNEESNYDIYNKVYDLIEL